ncbi:integrin alpha-X-like isoform X1 [Alexandromys fortis]|uniref:integrin alpha-X-like isoform X1 n=1 Tax=Alexandromys fortis TaxID=100897 RepID=UPI00215300FC|nr:integrin alpha-X-like isoform X1 [Microtus fortis]
MSRPWRALLLLTAFASSLGFNLDTEQLTRFHMDGAGFGHSVVQYDNTWVIVGAPKEMRATNQMGGLYKCSYHMGKCEPVHLQVPPEAVNMSLGLSLTAATNPSKLLACGPTVHHTCKENIYLTGLCFLLASSTPQQFPAAQQECPRQEQDIVFLIDGSGSIDSSNFKIMLQFVETVMSQFHLPHTQFSLMQFSDRFFTHFTFKDFISTSNPLMLLKSVRQLRGYTYTATAIKKVITELFTAQNGARKDATRVLIVITDGRKEGDHLSYEDVTPLADAKGIIRYAIGVGRAFYYIQNKQELEKIASKPSQEHVFQVENFDALKNIQNQLKEKIFAIEGTETASGSSFELEMSQEGFSAAITPDGLVLGAVGSFSWSGGAFLYLQNMSPTFISMPQENVDMRDAYLGYSTALAFRKGVYSLVLGAPRHQHTGKVVIFTQESRQWKPKSEVSGTQIGSYFGASLCSVDMDGDGSTDLVLIGTPHYYEKTRGGQVSVCPMPGGRSRWQCEATLHGEQGHPWGRFGAALTVLGDVNGDRVSDVAIGAPGEEENMGAVYIFHGASKLDVNPSPSQRISGSRLFPGLQYFGQSLSGGQDLTRDGLVDLVVGSKGNVLLLRTRPILRMLPTVRFSPSEIARSVFECQEQVASVQTLGDATVCLYIYDSSKTQLGDLKSSVTFDLALDPGRLSPRAIFEETKTQALTRVRILGLSRHCETVRLLLPACVEDSVTPITLRLNFSLVGLPIPSYQSLLPMLAVDEKTYYTASLPFEKNCGADHICQDDLGIIFGFPDLKTLVVGSDLELNVNVTVSNDGEDSYGTTVALLYPVGLSFRRVAEGQILLRGKEENQWRQRSLHLTCDSSPSRSQGFWRTSCSISHIIFRGGAQMTFLVTFDVSPKAVLGDRLSLTARVSSENDTPKTNKTTFQLKLPVKYAVYTVISSHDQSTKYLNFSASEKQKSSVVEHRYQVNNLGQRDVPASINFWVPVALKGEAVWTVKAPQLQNLPTQCYQNRIVPTQSDLLAHMQRSPMLDCSIADCLHFRCDIPSLGIQDELDFILKGNLSLGWVSQTLQKKVVVLSVAEITFDTSVYSQLPGQEAFLRAQVETVLEEFEVYEPISLIVGSSAGGLLVLALITAALYKLGFFKRRYKEMLDGKPGAPAPAGEADNSCETPHLLPS